jgi:hypothetical protein
MKSVRDKVNSDLWQIAYDKLNTKNNIIMSDARVEVTKRVWIPADMIIWSEVRTEICSHIMDEINEIR